MNYTKIRLNLEKQLGDEINQSVQGEIINEILKTARIEVLENRKQLFLEGHFFEITKALTPGIYKTFGQVIRALDFKEEIEFYICSQAIKDVVTIPRLSKGSAHIIALSSRLIDRLDEGELRFLIGYEIGKLITRNAAIARTVNFVFPASDTIPIPLKNKINFWVKLSDLSADRFAYIASPDIEKAVSCLFKLSSGLSAAKIKFDSSAYLVHNEALLADLSANEDVNIASYPVNPLRLKAIDIFSKSAMYKAITAGEFIDDAALDEEIHSLLSNFVSLFDSELDRHRMLFIALGGALIAKADKNIAESEYNNILKALNSFTLNPERILKKAMGADKATLKETLEISTAYILQKNSVERKSMFTYLINLALADNAIMKTEVRELFALGKSVFQYSETEIAEMIAAAIQESFIPKLF